MFSKKPETPRKPLRERVADRRSGRDKKTALPTQKKLSYIILAANILQGVGIMLLLFAMSDVVQGEDAVNDWTPIIIYSSMFIFGRAIVTLVGMMKKKKF